MHKIKLQKKTAILIAFSFLAGIVNGLIGTGGGVIIVFLLRYLYKDKNYDARDVFAGAVCCILPFTAVSAVYYAMARPEILSESLKYLIPAAIGGIAGAYLLGKLKLKITKKVFGAILILSGLLMIFR